MATARSNGPVSRRVLSVSLAAALCSAAWGATIVPVEQQRIITSFVIVPPCESTIWQDDEATSFRVFDSSVTAQRICDFAQGIAAASQQSAIGMSSLTATGATSSEAVSAINTVIHAISSSTYDVDFSVPFPSRFTISGELSAAGALPVVGSHALARLIAPGNVDVFFHYVEPGPGGALNSMTIEEVGVLMPGTYTLRVAGATVIDSTIPPMGMGNAAYDAVFEVIRLGDVNGDEAVDVADLLAVIGAWGECPAPSTPGPCPADISPPPTGDGQVDVNDLLMVIANWG